MDGVLAPTREQRLKYMHWLHVYGKDKTSIPRRMAELLQSYKVTWSSEVSLQQLDMQLNSFV